MHGILNFNENDRVIEPICKSNTVYHLECRPYQYAVEVLKKEIFCDN